MKVALYARVSKSDESQDPENQLIRLRAYAKERGWETFDFYIDKCSGADDHRPDLDRMVADAMRRRFGLVLTVKVDRVARSTINLYGLLSKLEGRGVKFECTDQDISTNTPTGKLLLAVLAGVAEFERDLIRERTKAGLARARAQGKQLGTPARIVDITRVLTLRGQGKSLREIGKALGVSHQTIKNRLSSVKQTRGVSPRGKTPRDETVT
jgi:DNA invertase Pin-like site-specific DNA recombinase